MIIDLNESLWLYEDRICSKFFWVDSNIDDNLLI